MKLAAAILAIVGIYWLAVEIAFRMTGGSVQDQDELSEPWGDL